MSRLAPEPTHAQLREALKFNQFRLYYQPIVALDDQRLEAAEALLRWEHPLCGLLTPDAFLALAETSGLIRDIGDWVLRQACRQVAEWRQRGLPAFTIAVNVSAVQARDDFAAKVLHALDAAHLPADALELELTESVAFGDPMLFATFETLRGLGVRFAADDFGTGYSCLRQLKCCPIGKLKIDQSFVARPPADARDRAIVGAVVLLGHGLSMRVVAEGVETTGALEALGALGVDAAQGYLFARPLPADRFEDYLRQKRSVSP